MAAKKGFDPVPPTLVIGEEVNRGSFGVVYLATLDKKSVAVKRFHKALMTSVGPEENVPLKNFKTECEQLKDLNHPNVVRYIGAYEDKKGPLLVMELMYESLEKYLKRNKGRLSPERVLEICSSICEGMAYLHGRDKPLIHRDLGSKNVLLTKEGVVKIADFGQSKLLQNCTGSLMTTQPGTISYMPPEALKKGGEYTAKLDSFSLGVLMLEICTQSAPSSGLDNIGGVIEVIRREDDLTRLDNAHPLKPLVVWCLQHEKLRPAVAVIHNRVKNVCETTKQAAQNKGIVQELKEELEDAKRTVDSLEDRLAKEIKSREELEEENLTFKQIIEQFQADFNAERKDREGAAGTFADREKEWMEEIRRVKEERDHLKALNMQFQDQTNHQRHEMERLERELKEFREMADGIAKKMTNQEASFRKQEADHRNQVHALHKQLEKLNKDSAKLKAELADRKKDAKGSKTIEEAYPRLYDEKKELEYKLSTAMEAKSLAFQHIRDLRQENQILKAEVEGYRQHLLQTSQELQGVRTQYQVLSSQTVTLREENDKLKQRMPTSQHQQQVPPHPIPVDESSYQSLPQMPSGPGQVVRLDYRPHPPYGGMPCPQYGDVSRPQYGDGTHPQHNKMQDGPYGGSLRSQDRELEEKDSPPNSFIPGHNQFLFNFGSQPRQHNQCYIGDEINREIRHEACQYKKAVEQGVPAPHNIDQSMLPLSRKDVEPNVVQQLEKHPSREGITVEIKMKADWLKRNPEDEVYNAPDDIDESIWPFDPNLECPHCGKRFRRGQIREYRYHLDDEHAP